MILAIHSLVVGDQSGAARPTDGPQHRVDRRHAADIPAILLPCDVPEEPPGVTLEHRVKHAAVVRLCPGDIAVIDLDILSELTAQVGEVDGADHTDPFPGSLGGEGVQKLPHLGVLLRISPCKRLLKG